MPDAERIENEIIECELVSNRQAESIYNLPLKLQLPNASAVQNRIASKYGKWFVLKGTKKFYVENFKLVNYYQMKLNAEMHYAGRCARATSPFARA